MARPKGSKTRRTRDALTPLDLDAVRRALVLSRTFIESEFKATNPTFSLDGVMWSKEELREELAKALSIIPGHPNSAAADICNNNQTTVGKDHAAIARESVSRDRIRRVRG